MKTLKVGIIGYGGMACYHAERMRKTGLMTVSGSFDTDKARQTAAKKAGLKVYGSSQELLSDKEIDAVLIATPNNFHCDYAIAAAKEKKHIICEKPVAMNCEELDRMELAAKENGVIFSVHQNRRWDSDYIAAKQINESGVIGRIYRIDSIVSGANGIPGGWRKSAASGGGMMLDWGVHIIDQIFDFIKEQPISLYCRYSFVLGFEVDDGFDAHIGFENGLDVNVRVDTNTFTKLPRWTLYGLDGTAVIEDWDLNGKIILPVYTQTKTEGIQAGNGFTKTMAYRSHDSVTEQQIPRPVVDSDAFYKNFVAATQGKEKQAVSYESVRKVMRIMELCKLSNDKNSVIKDELGNL